MEMSNELDRLLFFPQAPQLHQEILKHGLGKQTLGAGPSTSSSSTTTATKNKKSNLKYDMFGWIILAVGIVTWVANLKCHLPTLR